MQRSIISATAAVLCTGWMIFSAQPAAAQGQPPTPNISGQKLDQTAAAIQKVQKIRASYVQKLSAASPEEKNKIASEEDAAAQKAVTDQGLSVDEYNSIVQLAQNDPNVHAQIMKRLDSAAK